MESFDDVVLSGQAFNDAVRIGINALTIEAFGNSEAHGFWGDYQLTGELIANAGLNASLGDKYVIDTKLSKIALIVSELGEAVEGIRKPHADEHCPEFTSEEIELADAIIRIGDYAGAFNLRLEGALLAKMAYNRSRPFKHGKGA